MNWGLYFLYSAGQALTENGNKWGEKSGKMPQTLAVPAKGKSILMQHLRF